MTAPVPPVAGRIAALVLLGTILALVWMAGVTPLLDRYRADRELVAFAAEQLPRLQRLTAETPVLRAELDRVASDPAGRTRLLDGTSDALAGADLQNRVARSAKRYGLVMRSAQILPPAEEEGFRRIGIRVALEGEIAGLRRLLYAVETAPTFLFIDNLEIRSRGGARVVRRRDGKTKSEGMLTIRFDVRGYRREEKP